jgi:hypothetical protein
VIGPAGEQLARIAGISHIGTIVRSAARSGLGAVWGSKNLKAVVAGGSQKAALADASTLEWEVKAISLNIRTGAGHKLAAAVLFYPYRFSIQRMVSTSVIFPRYLLCGRKMGMPHNHLADDLNRGAGSGGKGCSIYSALAGPRR